MPDDSGGTYDLAVIGGGPAGVTAALRAAELGARVVLLERDSPGGTCTDDGCAPTRVLARAARLVRDADQLASYGITASERPLVDVEQLMEATQRTVYQLHEKKQLIAHLERAGVHVVRGRGPARFVDPHRLAVADGTTVRAERAIVAAGGHARRGTIPGSELALTHSDVWGLRRLPRSMAVVGAAATGVQLASIFAALGSRVTLLEVAPRIVPGEDPDTSRALGDGLHANGVELITGIGGIDAIRREAAGLVVDFTAGGKAREASVETVILAIGWPGNVGQLGLEAAGVRTERGYVVVDDRLRTSVPHIWAAGDITGRMMLVQSATYEGRFAAENALASGDRSVRHDVVAHGGFTDPEYGSVGMTEPAARQLTDVVIGRVAYSDLDRAVIDGRTAGFCKLVVDARARTILGAHVAGEQAVEVVQVAAAAMAADMRVEQLAEVEFAYPTYTSIIALAARQVVHGLRLEDEAEERWEAMGRPRVSEWERREA